jgi:hypothetical protein
VQEEDLTEVVEVAGLQKRRLSTKPNSANLTFVDYKYTLIGLEPFEWIGWQQEALHAKV